MRTSRHLLIIGRRGFIRGLADLVRTFGNETGLSRLGIAEKYGEDYSDSEMYRSHKCDLSLLIRTDSKVSTTVRLTPRLDWRLGWPGCYNHVTVLLQWEDTNEKGVWVSHYVTTSAGQSTNDEKYYVTYTFPSDDPAITNTTWCHLSQLDSGAPYIVTGNFETRTIHYTLLNDDGERWTSAGSILAGKYGRIIRPGKENSRQIMNSGLLMVIHKMLADFRIILPGLALTEFTYLNMVAIPQGAGPFPVGAQYKLPCKRICNYRNLPC